MTDELTRLRHANDRLTVSHSDLQLRHHIGMEVADRLNDQLTADLAKARADLATAVAALKMIERRGVNSASAIEARRALDQITGHEAAPANKLQKLRQWLKGKLHG